jgi:hypothetical protein
VMCLEPSADWLASPRRPLPSGRKRGGSRSVFVGVTDPPPPASLSGSAARVGRHRADEANPARQVGKDPSAKFWSGKVDGLRGPAFDRPIGLLIMAACTSNNSICFPLPASKWIVLCP